MGDDKRILYVIQSCWDGEWEDVHAETTRVDALAQLHAYRTSEPGTPHRMRRRLDTAA